ncbi:MAG: Glyoxalase/bleomycin resistance protein/dioxygenase [Acidimicrobiales bacterium]|nr:Glyoxalase/bleomycin resistance protein/dioxygenase [Acidimicrobiales bacterium]
MEVLSSRLLVRPRDFERSLHFWRDQIGLRVYREYGSGGQVTGVVLFCGGGFLELTAAGPDEGHGLGAAAVWLQVPDVADEVARLRGLSVDVEDPQLMPWGLHEAWLADPDGLRIVLVEVPTGHPIRTRLD